MEDKEVLNKTEEEINNTEDSTEAETAETATDEVKADETKEGADTSEEKADLMPALSVVHPEGFEPTTPCSEDKCSNPLSYRCLAFGTPRRI